MPVMPKPLLQIHPIAVTATGFTWGPLTLDRVSETADQLVLQGETAHTRFVIQVNAQGYGTRVSVQNRGADGQWAAPAAPSFSAACEPDADARLVVRTTVKGIGWGGATVNMGYFDQKFYVQDPGGRWLYARQATLGEHAGIKDGTLLARN